MGKPEYPLQQVLEVKQRRVEEAEKVVKEKQAALEKEEEKLKEREAARDKVKTHYQEKLTQFRKQLDEGTTSPKIKQAKDYIKVVSDDLKVEQKKVTTQEEQVKTAKKNLSEAQDQLKIKRQEVDKLNMHQTDWAKSMKKEMDLQEEREQDELGFLVHLSNKRKTD